MNLKKLIIHELKKEFQKTGASVITSESCLPLTPSIIELAEKLLNSFEDQSPFYAIFDKKADGSFFQNFNAFHNGQESDELFRRFSSNTINNLKEQIQGVILAKGGFFVYLQYEKNGFDNIGIFLIRDTKGLVFKRNENRKLFDINEVKYLNLDKLAMACRINISGYENFTSKQQNYIALIKKGQQDISDYFNNWISIAQLESSEDYTKELYHIVSSLPAPINPTTNLPYEIDEIRKQVADYINTQPQKYVNLQQLSAHFYSDEKAIGKYAEENNIIIDNEFKAHKQALRNFFNIYVRTDGITLSFSRGDIRTGKLSLGRDNPNIVIIESAAVAEAVKNQIETT